MPSPVGHSLASIAVGWAVNRPAKPWRELLIQSATLTAIGISPDLDILWGRHSRETHSLGAALIVATIAMWWRWPVGEESRPRIFLAALLAYFIHPVLDTLAIDSDPPLGVMLWWPFSSGFVHSAHAFFDPISRYWHESWTWPHNFTAGMHEFLMIAPFTLLVGILRHKVDTSESGYYDP